MSKAACWGRQGASQTLQQPDSHLHACQLCAPDASTKGCKLRACEQHLRHTHIKAFACIKAHTTGMPDGSQVMPATGLASSWGTAESASEACSSSKWPPSQHTTVAAAEQIKLVVVDSVTFHFRQDVTDMGQRTRRLAAMAQQLMQAAEAHDTAVCHGARPWSGVDGLAVHARQRWSPVRLACQS